MIQIFKSDDERIIIQDTKNGPTKLRIWEGFISIQGPSINLIINLESNDEEFELVPR